MRKHPDTKTAADPAAHASELGALAVIVTGAIVATAVCAAGLVRALEGPAPLVQHREIEDDGSKPGTSAVTPEALTCARRQAPSAG